jgi:hypothetical protein
MTKTQASALLVVVCAAIALVLVVWLVWLRSETKVYDTPEQAVTKSCHAAKLMGRYPTGHVTDIRIGWQQAGQPLGDGWAARVVHADGGYRVDKCKYLQVGHG